MLFYEFNAGDKTYKLRLNTRNIVGLEKALGCNPLSIFGSRGDKIPTITEMVAILQASMQQYQHGTNTNSAYDIFDEYLADGHTPVDFIPVIVEIYKASGLISASKEEEDEKN